MSNDEDARREIDEAIARLDGAKEPIGVSVAKELDQQLRREPGAVAPDSRETRRT